MWANAQHDGHHAEYRWCSLFNAIKFGVSAVSEMIMFDAHYWSAVHCNAAKTRNPLKFAGVPQTNEMISAASGPKFPILWGHLEEISLLNKFFSDCRYMP